MGINWAGIGAAYEGYQDENRRAAEDERKQQADARMAQDAAFQDETRSRIRSDWAKEDLKRQRTIDFLNKDTADEEEYKKTWNNPDAAGDEAPNAIQSLKAQVAANMTDPSAPVKMSFAPDQMPATATEAMTNPPPQGNVPPPSILQKAIGGLGGSKPAAKVNNTDGSTTPVPNPGVDASAGANTSTDTDTNTDTNKDNNAVSSKDGNTNSNVDGSTDGNATAQASAPYTANGGFSPAVIKQQLQPAGLPKPDKFADALGRQSRLLDYQASLGDIDTSTYATQKAMLNKLRAEGVHDALDLMDQGNGEDAINAFNHVGMYRNMRYIDQRKATTTLPNGQQIPTNIVTLQRADGSKVEVDSALAKYNLMSMSEKLSNADKAAQTKATAEHNAGILKVAQQQAGSLQQARSGAGRSGVNTPPSAAGNPGSANNPVLDARALDAELRNNAYLYQITPPDGGRPYEHVGAKTLYTSLLQDPTVDSDNAKGVLLNIKRAAENQSVDENTGGVDPKRFLPIFNSMVQEAQRKNVKANAPPFTDATKMTRPLSDAELDNVKSRINDYADALRNDDSGLASPKPIRDLQSMLVKHKQLLAQKEEQDAKKKH